MKINCYRQIWTERTNKDQHFLGSLSEPKILQSQNHPTYLRNIESENEAEGNACIVGVEKHTHPLKCLLNVLILHESKSVDDQDEIPER